DLQRKPGYEVISAWNYNLQIRALAEQNGAPPDKALDVSAIAMEGWEWLRSHGFIAPHREHIGQESLTRAGRGARPQEYLAQSRGLGILRQADLDPELRRTVEPLMVRDTNDDAVL